MHSSCYSCKLLFTIYLILFTIVGCSAAAVPFAGITISSVSFECRGTESSLTDCTPTSNPAFGDHVILTCKRGGYLLIYVYTYLYFSFDVLYFCLLTDYLTCRLFPFYVIVRLL